MRKIKEVHRLKFSVGLGLRAIAPSCSIGLGTVQEYLHRAEAAGLTWPLGENWDEDRLESVLFAGPPRPFARRRCQCRTSPRFTNSDSVIHT